MQSAAIGFRVHSGWTAMVALFVEKNDPRVLLRGRPHLVETFTYQFRQPYHTAERMPLEKAREFIARVESESRVLGERAIGAAKDELHEHGYLLEAFSVLQASGKPLPSLERILASHAMIHTADGELFRAALAQAGERCGLRACPVKERELLSTATRALRIPPVGLAGRLMALGKPLGAPWTQDEKFAAIAAWLALLPRSEVVA